MAQKQKSIWHKGAIPVQSMWSWTFLSSTKINQGRQTTREEAILTDPVWCITTMVLTVGT